MVQRPGARYHRPESRDQGRDQSPETKGQGPETRDQGQGTRDQRPWSRDQGPGTIDQRAGGRTTCSDGLMQHHGSSWTGLEGSEEQEENGGRANTASGHVCRTRVLDSDVVYREHETEEINSDFSAD
ncbi:uncharacterized protein V6R79_012661 [Siganus canaliculatus]